MPTARQRFVAFWTYFGAVFKWSAHWSAEHWKVVSTALAAGLMIAIGVGIRLWVVEKYWPALAKDGPTMNELWAILLYTAVPGVIVALAVFLSLCALAPSQIHLEQSVRVKELESELKKKTEPATAVEQARGLPVLDKHRRRETFKEAIAEMIVDLDNSNGEQKIVACALRIRSRLENLLREGHDAPKRFAEIFDGAELGKWRKAAETKKIGSQFLKDLGTISQDQIRH